MTVEIEQTSSPEPSGGTSTAAPRRRSRRRWLAALGLIAALYAALQAWPQLLFTYRFEDGELVVHTRRPVPEAALRATLADAKARLAASPIYVATARKTHLYFCDSPWLFALFEPIQRNAGAVARVSTGGHVFLRPADFERGHLISPSGKPVGADRPLAYFIAHELVHVALGRHLGAWRYHQLPRWVDDGYADYVARSIDYAQALRGFQQGTPELDPSRSGLYLRYHLMVAFLLEKKGLGLTQLLESPPRAEKVERELAALSRW